MVERRSHRQVAGSNPVLSHKLKTSIPHNTMHSQLTISFSEDRRTAIHMQIKANRERAESNCHKLLAFWQKQNWHIDKYYAKDELGIDCLAQRIKNLRDAGVAVASNTNTPNKGEPQSRY